MLATSKKVLFPGHNHLLTASADGARAIIDVSCHQHWWLTGGDDVEIGHFIEVASMAVTWWILAFLRCA